AAGGAALVTRAAGAAATGGSVGVLFVPLLPRVVRRVVPAVVVEAVALFAVVGRLGAGRGRLAGARTIGRAGTATGGLLRGARRFRATWSGVAADRVAAAARAGFLVAGAGRSGRRGRGVVPAGTRGRGRRCARAVGPTGFGPGPGGGGGAGS